jgi:hypothetical protein
MDLNQGRFSPRALPIRAIIQQTHPFRAAVIEILAGRGQHMMAGSMTRLFWKFGEWLLHDR